MIKCLYPRKIHHKTQRLAFDQLRGVRSHQQHPGGGYALKALNVYDCPCGGGWCVGHSRDRKTALQPKPETTKIPSMGELRRKYKRLLAAEDKQRKHRAYLIGQIIEADSEQERLNQELRALQDAALREIGYL